MRPTELIKRFASCTEVISMENTATGILSESPAYSAIFKAKDVLPMEGRPATMMRSPFCSPEVMRSNTVKPVGSPVTSSLLLIW